MVELLVKLNQNYLCKDSFKTIIIINPLEE